MFIGHYGAAFVAAARPKAPRLGTLFIAAQLIDFGFFAFLILGIEHMRLVPGTTAMNPMDLYFMPWTHSMVGALAWSLAFAALIWSITRNRSAALLAGAVVFSHWLVDLIVHAPDLTLMGAPPKLGLALWNYPLIEIPLELFFAFGGLHWYLSRTDAIAPGGRWGAWALALAMAGLQAFNWFGPVPSGIVDPPPASTGPLGLFAYTLLALIAWWMARNREPRLSGR
ncbi:MAG: hypothetical protein K2P68_03730 [Sphingomonas sp.]|nr:hypothetical protein [Sphingomonas sp.]